jgi:heat shock protein HslJ
MKRGHLISFVIFLVAFTACSSGEESNNGILLDETEGVFLNGTELAQTEWVLTSMNGKPLLDGTNITLAFSLAELSGFAGCNSYGSQYELSDNDQINILEIASQAEGCLEPQGVLVQESEYLKQLLNVTQYKIEQNALALSNQENEQALIFALRESFGMDPAALEDTQWLLLASEDFPLKDGSRITISFSKGEIEGFGGCRNYEGQYMAEEDRIVFPVLLMTSDLCSDPDLQIQEDTFTSWLELSTHYLIEENQLQLFLADGNNLVFERLD